MILILKNLEKNELLSLVFVTTTKIIMFTHFRHILHTYKKKSGLKNTNALCI